MMGGQGQFADGFADGMCLAVQQEGVTGDGLLSSSEKLSSSLPIKQVLQRCIAAVTDMGYGLINVVVGEAMPNMA